MHDFHSFRIKAPISTGIDAPGTLEKHLEKMFGLANDINCCTDKRDKKEKEELISQLKAKAQNAASIDPHLSWLWTQAMENTTELESEKKPYKTVANALRKAWDSKLALREGNFDMLGRFDTIPDISEVKNLPCLSFMLSIPFCLAKPYISKDDEHFYLIDNPVRKEKLFGNPMVPSTSWKGAMRHALLRLSHIQKNPKVTDDALIRLFGNHDACAPDDFISGRLHFFPSYFDRSAIEIINPHDRQRGTATARGPILIEAVPAYRKAVFTLLYLFTPDRSNQYGDENRAMLLEDLSTIAIGIRAMMTVYGFGAKTSSGFGVAQEQLPRPEGRIAMRIPEREILNGAGSVALWKFSTFSDLCNLVEHLCKTLIDGAENG
ncbi:MAG: hypothetical protein HGA97_10640 [Chlorobiaceae bacterium]|nr:hypothetical protein [Chlorobiaceae bacterium]